MDFCSKAKPLSNALIQYGEQRAGLNQNDANNNIQRILNGNDAAASTIVARVPKEDGVPYGFDHNYVIDNDDGQLEKKSTRLRVAAILYHSPTGRALRVLTSSPGMQLYTSNHLDGKTPTSTLCKDNTSYPQWQGICLETQTFPDSIYPNDKNIDMEDDEFAQGRCFILRPGGANYHHDVEYEFLNMNAIWVSDWPYCNAVLQRHEIVNIRNLYSAKKVFRCWAILNIFKLKLLEVGEICCRMSRIMSLPLW